MASEGVSGSPEVGSAQAELDAAIAAYNRYVSDLNKSINDPVYASVIHTTIYDLRQQVAGAKYRVERAQRFLQEALDAEQARTTAPPDPSPPAVADAGPPVVSEDASAEPPAEEEMTLSFDDAPTGADKPPIPHPEYQAGPPEPPVTGLTIEITTPGGKPLTIVPREQPFVVTVRLPPNAPFHPPTLDVKFQTSAGTQTLSIAHRGGGPRGYVYQSDTITLGRGGQGGDSISVLPGTPARLEFATGGVGSITTKNEETVTVSTLVPGSTAATTFQAFDNARDATIFFGTQYIAAYDNFVRNILISLRTAPDTAATRQLRQWAEGKFTILQSWHIAQGNANWGPLEEARWVIAYSNALRDEPDTRTRFFTDEMDRAAHDLHEVYVGAYLNFLVDFSIGIYQLYIGSLPLVAPLWTIFTKTDIMGNKVDGWEYAVAILDAAGQSAMIALPMAFNSKYAVSGTTPRVILGEPPKATAFNVPITRAPAGTFIKDVTEIGITNKQAGTFNRRASLEVQAEADRAASLQANLRAKGDLNIVVEPRFREVHLQFRPMEAGVIKRLGEGFNTKPEPLKPKTINEVDIKGGWARSEDQYVLGFFTEKQIGDAIKFDFTKIDDATLRSWTEKAPPPPEGVDAKVWDRAIQRAQEFRDQNAHILDYKGRGLLTIDEHGRIINLGICDYQLDPVTHELVLIPGIEQGTGSGKPITGDPDGWDFVNEKGQPLPGAVADQLVHDLYPAGVKHGLVARWDIENNPHYTPEEKAVNIGIRDKILGGHAGEVKPDGTIGPIGGAKAVADFGGLTKPRSTAYGGVKTHATMPKRWGKPRRKAVAVGVGGGLVAGLGITLGVLLSGGGSSHTVTAGSPTSSSTSSSTPSSSVSPSVLGASVTSASSTAAPSSTPTAPVSIASAGSSSTLTASTAASSTSSSAVASTQPTASATTKPTVASTTSSTSASTTPSTVASGPGSKSTGSIQLGQCPDATYTSSTFFIDVNIPSTAKNPYYTLNPPAPFCPPATEKITTRIKPAGPTTPPGHVVYEIQIDETYVSGAGGAIPSTNATVYWS